MGDIHELAERHWQGELDLADLAHHPVRRPGQGVLSGEVAPEPFVLKSVATVNAIDPGDGLVMLHTGGHFDVDDVYTGVRRTGPGPRATPR